MADRVPGSLCFTRLGRAWIDEGTSCRWRSPLPSPLSYALAAGEDPESSQLPLYASVQGPLHREARREPIKPPAVAVERFDATGPNSQLGPGLTNMLITSLTQIQGDFAPVVVEWEHRAELQREIDLSNSPLADPSTRLTKQWISPDILVRGSVRTTDADTMWNIKLVDTTTGEIIGVDNGAARGETILDAPAGIAERLTQQMRKYSMRKQQAAAEQAENPAGQWPPSP